MDAVLTCMVSDHIGPGQKSRELVSQVSSFLETKGGVAFREYRRAAEAAVDALDLPDGASVIVSPLLPAFYGPVLRQRGFSLLPADVDPETAQMDPVKAGELMDRNPAAVLVPSSLGFCGPLEEIRELGLPLLEDVSEGLGASVETGRAGTFGDVVVLAMEMEHIVTSGGGALVLARDKDRLKKLEAVGGGFDPSVYLPDMNAALGEVQMKELEELLEKRTKIAAAYRKGLMKGRHGTFVQKHGGENVPYSYPVLLDTGLKDVHKYALKQGVETRPAFSETLLAREEAPQEVCPAAASLMRRCLLFPLYPFLGSKNVAAIEKVLSTLP